MLCVSFLALAAATPAPNKALVWANSPAALVHRGYHVAALEGMAAFSRRLDGYLAEHSASAVVFVAQTGALDFAQMQGLSSLLRQKGSSVVLPYVYSEEQSAVDTFTASKSMKSADRVSFAEFKSLVKQQKQGIVNRRLLVEVSSEDAAELEAAFLDYAAAAQQLRTQAFAVLVEDASTASVADVMPASYSRRLSNDLSQNGLGFTIYVDGTYLLITPELVAGLLTGLFFLVVVYIGSSCMNDIETPDQFAKVRPMLGKEF